MKIFLWSDPFNVCMWGFILREDLLELSSLTIPGIGARRPSLPPQFFAEFFTSLRLYVWNPAYQLLMLFPVVSKPVDFEPR
jgi:hypothetical protein